MKEEHLKKSEKNKPLGRIQATYLDLIYECPNALNYAVFGMVVDWPLEGYCNQGCSGQK